MCSVPCLFDAVSQTMCSPGFLDIQINGAYNFDFSVYDGDDEAYLAGLRRVGERIVETGVTSCVAYRNFFIVKSNWYGQPKASAYHHRQC